MDADLAQRAQVGGVNAARGPVVAVLAVMIRDGRVLLARRANRPDAGLWGFPGGKVDFGESIEAAAVRELFEETRVIGEPLQVLTALDVFDREEGGLLQQHFVLVAVLCRWRSGEPRAGDDALDARWFALEDVDPATLPMSARVVEVAQLAADAGAAASRKPDAP